MDYTRKTRWVLDGHKTPPPERSTYTGVVSRDSVCIALTYAALNHPDVWMRPAKKADGSECYEYVLICTDDVLVVSENGEHVLRAGIGKYFGVKGGEYRSTQALSRRTHATC